MKCKFGTHDWRLRKVSYELCKFTYGKIMVNDPQNDGIQFHTESTNVCEL